MPFPEVDATRGPFDPTVVRVAVGPGPLPERRVANLLVKALVDDRGTAEERRTRYGARVRDFLLWPSPSGADMAVLGRPWEGYGKADREDIARFIHEAGDAGLAVLVFAGGDLEPVVPFANTILFHAGLYRSVRRAQPAFALPYSFSDRLGRYADGLQVRSRHDRPVVGFCGQAASRPGAALKRRAVAAAAQVRAAIGTSPVVPNQYPRHVELRRKVLAALAASSRVETNFVIRDRYRAGLGPGAGASPDHPANREFHQNLLDSDYVVCIRGTGNFSARFYEALSFGRIPVLVDTDVRLPFDFELDWRDRCVWVEEPDVDHVAERVADFHAGLTSQDFERLQVELRRLWLERLTENGFFEHFGDHFGSSSA